MYLEVVPQMDLYAHFTSHSSSTGFWGPPKNPSSRRELKTTLPNSVCFAQDYCQVQHKILAMKVKKKGFQVPTDASVIHTTFYISDK